MPISFQTLQIQNIQRRMSESQLGSTNCSNCNKPRQKFDIFTTKCIKHSYKLCAVCTRVTRGIPCPECTEKKTEDQPSPRQKKEEPAPVGTAPTGTELANDEVVIKNSELKKLMGDVTKWRQERDDLSKNVGDLELEKASKQLEIKNLQIEKFKVKQRCDDELRKTQNEHAKQILDLRKNFQIQTSKLSEKLEGESKLKQGVLAKQNEDLKKKLLVQKEEMKRFAELETTLLKSSFENEKQKLKLELQDQRSQDLMQSDTREKQLRQEYQTQIKDLRTRYQNQLKDTRVTSQKQKELLVTAFGTEKDTIITRLEKQKKELNDRLEFEKNELIQTYEKEKEVYRGSYIDEKEGLEELMEARIQQHNKALQSFNQEHSKLKETFSEKEAERQKHQAQYQRIITEKNEQISKVTAEKNALSKYIESHDHSLDHYQKQIIDFDRYIERSNINIIEQFKSLDETYDEPTPEKIKMTQLLVKQYKEVVASTKHPQLMRIINQKQSMVSNYVASEMMQSQKALQEMDVRDLYYIQTEKGKNFKRIIQKIGLFRSLDNQNINESIDMYFQPRLTQKLKTLLTNSNQKITNCNSAMSEFDLIKEIDEFYQIRQFLRREFSEHEPLCESEYKNIDENIKQAFDRFNNTYSQVKENKPGEKLEEYLNKAEQLKKFMQIVDHSKSYIRYTRQLEDYLGLKMDQIKVGMLDILNQNKKSLKSKLENLMVTRVYFDCYLYQKIFKKLKIFDEILTKEENSYYNFNFSELYNKIINFLRILKDEKMNLCDVLITDQKINIEDLQRQFSGISFDESIRIRYIYKLKNVMQNRNASLSKLNGNTIITNKHLQEFQNFYTEAHQLATIKLINQIPEIPDQIKLFELKMIVLVDYLELKFKECYGNTTELKEMDETNRNIKHFYEFEMFVQKNFAEEHAELKKRIDPLRYSLLPKPETQDQCIFATLLRLNVSNNEILSTVLTSPEEPLKDEHFEYYTNMISFLPKVEGSKVQQKLHKAVMGSVSQMETKQWVEGEVNSQTERKLMFYLNKLQNKEIAYYRELVNIHKNRILQERQRIINNEKRKLKEDDFQNLQLFLKECQKNEASNSKFHKLYINILEEYMNYSYDNIANNIDKKANFLTHLYKLNISDKARSVRQIFKSKEHKIYFCRPELAMVRSNICLIEKFEGENDTDVSKLLDPLVDAIRLYSIFRDNESKSFLEDKQRQKFSKQIELISGQVVGNYLNLCRYLEHERIFDQKCNRKKLFLDLIKIEIYGRVMKKWQEYHPHHEYFNNRAKYEEIVNKINGKIEKAYEQVKQFRFYKDDMKLQYDNNNFLFQHLKKIERLVEIFKEIKYRLFKFEDFLKKNYLEELQLKSISHKDLVSIVQMSWIKEYAGIKKQISDLFATKQMDIVLKYKMILHQKEIVKNENLLCFNEIIKEEYDFKRIVIDELMVLESKIERYLQNLQKEHESFVLSEKKLEDKKKIHVQSEKARIKHKYEKLIAEVQNSFHEVNDEAVREKKIEAEINTLVNQARSEEEQLLNQQALKMENFRTKFTVKSDNTITKFFDSLMVIKKVESNFDTEIEDVCKKIVGKVQVEIDKFDKGLKNVFISYAKKAKDSDMILGSLNLFQQIKHEQFQLNTKAMNDIHEIIKKCPQTKNDEELSSKLAVAFDEYKAELERVEKEFFDTRSENKVLQLIKDTKAEARALPPAVVIARIFAVYSIYRCIDTRQEEIIFDGNPHIAQIVAILLLIDAQNGRGAKFGNRLIEVKTGEGKSRVLAGLNCYLAVYGYDVYCGCYSSYLSQRDEEEFHSLFVRFGVDKMISYGPFSEHCESVFNEGTKHNFKEVTKKVLLNQPLSTSNLEYLERLNKLLKRENRVNRVLVIDEVDVFFDQHYFGKIYAPGIAISSPEVKNLIKFIWENHSDKRLNRMVFQSQEYRVLTGVFPHLQELLKNQVESMIHACNNYSLHPYEIRNNEIQYVDNDTVNSKLNFGYSTAFASCYEFERGKISEANYNKNTNITLIIGQFSYAELPKYFDNIMGVSGTVEAMSDFRKKIMRDDYKISDIYTLPSIYGDSHREIVGYHSCQKPEYLRYLLERIHTVRKAQRPILVFFETEEQLNLVSNSPEFNQFTTNIYKITEKMPPEMRNPLINYAGTKNRITLISSAFSRGTDFTVYDSDINEKGGMHVIQTYLSKNESDFIQILGRTGRQGKNGSFELIVTKEDLKKNQIPMVEDDELMRALKQSWKANDIKYGRELSNSIEEARKLHEVTFDVVGSMAKENSRLVDAVMKLNFNEIKGETIKTIIAIDGTGSMGAALNAVLTILKDTISRTDEIISMRMPNVSFEHKIMIYRNYNTNLEKILEQSSFSKDPAYLQAFMTSIKPEGGLGNEAHEVLFYDIGKQLEYEKIDQIIVIGDAPANKFEEMSKHRKKFRGDAYWDAKFPLLGSIEQYSAVVKSKAIPVHSFYILRRKQEEESIKWDKNVKLYFEDLSNESKGAFEELNIRDKEKSKDQLTDFISERVLELIGGRDLIDLYTQMFSKRYV